MKAVRRIAAGAAALLVALGLTVGTGVTPALASTNYTYFAGGSQAYSADGVSANFTIANPFLKTTAPAESHSLAEIAAQSADGQQTVEFGWTVDKSLYGDTLTRLFAFRWVNGVPGTYNGGFIDCTVALCGASTSTYSLGDAITADVGTIKAMAVQHSGTNWWVSYAGKWVAYIPDTTWSGATPPVTFTTGGYFQVWGEVATGTAITSGKPCTDMGTGDLGASGGASASISAVLFIGHPTTDVNLYIRTASDYPGSPSLAGIYTVFYTASSNQRSFGYGGPGYNSAGTAAGTKGSC